MQIDELYFQMCCLFDCRGKFFERFYTYALKISDGAAELLTNEYKRLRMGDSNNAATSSWRITVRQLESLIRLSEALSKLYCSDEVHILNFQEFSVERFFFT